GSAERKHIHIKNGIIRTITARREMLEHLQEERLELNGVMVLPGFINSHDHLDFNLFPQLCNRLYANYTEWGRDIHRVNADVIGAVQKVPLNLRIQWGLYKNLLNGFTTVVNHGECLRTGDELVNVFQDCYSLHSPAFEKNWILKLNHPLRNRKPFVMHIGEGTDEAAGSEINTVIRSNFFTRRIIAVHGVAMDKELAASFAAIVWCPASNFFLLGKTASVDLLKQDTKIIFGTDSTLTSSWYAGEHFKTAMGTGMVDEEELLSMLTVMPAHVWGLEDRGSVEEGMRADLLIMEDGNKFFSERPAGMLIVINGGEIKVLAENMQQLLQLPGIADFDKIVIKGKRMLVKPGLLKLVKEILSFYPAAEIPFDID
ncbi:MAG: amidohydrolase family protein, partial [Chitinophagaceae bacterium]|nr:amidohydrolase family protein [Chitinophagaceae bacterium]